MPAELYYAEMLKFTYQMNEFIPGIDISLAHVDLPDMTVGVMDESKKHPPITIRGYLEEHYSSPML